MLPRPPGTSVFWVLEHADSEVGRHRGPLPGKCWEVLRVMDTCEKTLLRYPPPLPPARRCFGSFNTWTPEYQRHRGPLPGGLVHRWEVLRAMDTCEKTPCRYSLALPCPCFLNTWTPDNGRHRGPLPGGQVLATLELRSLLTSIYIPAHVFPSLVSKCSLAQWSLGEPIVPRATILFWMGSEHLPYVFRCSRQYPQMCTKLQTSR